MIGSVIDIGNTTVGLARCDEGRVLSTYRIPATSKKWSEARAEEVLSAVCLKGEPSIIASVAPALTEFVASVALDMTGRRPLLVSHQLDLGIVVDYPRPNSIGADRLANAVGAVRRFGSPVIVADFGTALTFDVVEEGDRYTGGVILPGLSFMTDYLSERTALLPRIEVCKDVGSIGKSTREAMEIGALVGYRGIVREVVAHLEKAMEGKKPIVCATGGHCEMVLADSDLGVEIVPDLTFEGLFTILARNSADR